ncbi:glycosyltransferase [Coleofasciculus sp.]|uniref:glycosyltransferase n=1 Tax=Coleofasciculus sp. TaxID=3100458 RepID=UPI003A293675
MQAGRPYTGIKSDSLPGAITKLPRLTSNWLKRLTGTPYWVIVHGLEGWNLSHPLRQKALRHADKIIAVSHYTRDRLLQEQQLNPAQISVLPNTFAATQFQPTPKPDYLLQRLGDSIQSQFMALWYSPIG